MKVAPTPRVTVVTGPLGAGKTTLVNAWLSQFARGDVAVIVNEFGDVGVDGELLAERAREVVELTGGCVCCATQADLVRALIEMASRPSPPRRVIIETSGAASPAGVVRSLTRGPVSRRMGLDGVITVVDATRTERVRDSLLCGEQVAYADVVVLTRADACAPDALREAGALIAARNPAAAIAHAARGAVVTPAAATLDALLAARGEDFNAPWALVRAEAGTHDAGIESVSLTHDGALDGDRFSAWVEHWVEEMGGRLMRVKGILAVATVPVRVVLQCVGDSVEVSFGAPWGDAPPRSRMVLIGYGLDADGLRAGFAACATITTH